MFFQSCNTNSINIFGNDEVCSEQSGQLARFCGFFQRGSCRCAGLQALLLAADSVIFSSSELVNLYTLQMSTRRPRINLYHEAICSLLIQFNEACSVYSNKKKMTMHTPISCRSGV